MSKSTALQLIERGLKKGREEGLEKGLEKGIEKEKLEMAKRLLQEKTDIAFILRITGQVRSAHHHRSMQVSKSLFLDAGVAGRIKNTFF